MLTHTSFLLLLHAVVVVADPNFWGTGQKQMQKKINSHFSLKNLYIWCEFKTVIYDLEAIYFFALLRVLSPYFLLHLKQQNSCLWTYSFGCITCRHIVTGLYYYKEWNNFRNLSGFVTCFQRAVNIGVALFPDLSVELERLKLMFKRSNFLQSLGF